MEKVTEYRISYDSRADAITSGMCGHTEPCIKKIQGNLHRKGKNIKCVLGLFSLKWDVSVYITQRRQFANI